MSNYFRYFVFRNSNLPKSLLNSFLVYVYFVSESFFDLQLCYTKYLVYPVFLLILKRIYNPTNQDIVGIVSAT